MSESRDSRLSPYLAAVRADDTLPIDTEAVNLWLKDLANPLRWFVRPILQLVFAVVLHVTWFLKRLPLPQFSGHRLLQATICWFCTYCVSPEANRLILRHFWTESNILNFLRDNSSMQDLAPLDLYPVTVDDMRKYTFVDHDQELFRVMAGLGSRDAARPPKPPAELNWTHWREISLPDAAPKRWSQIVDFETSHALFMCLFCFLLTAEEYRDAINGFSLDQSIAIRVGSIISDPSVAELAYNKYPHYLVGPWNLTQRFLMHGFFTEYLHARLEAVRARA
jgi:hypothetical protein